MTEAETSIYLHHIAKRLETIKANIIADLPEELSVKKTIRPMFRFGNTPEQYEVTLFPILGELNSFIDELSEHSEMLKRSAAKLKVKV